MALRHQTLEMRPRNLERAAREDDTAAEPMALAINSSLCTRPCTAATVVDVKYHPTTGIKTKLEGKKS